MERPMCALPGPSQLLKNERPPHREALFQNVSKHHFTTRIVTTSLLERAKTTPEKRPLKRVAKATVTRPRQDDGSYRFRSNVHFWHKADITNVLKNVRFWGESGHRVFRMPCPVRILARASRPWHCGCRHTNRAHCRSGRSGPARAAASDPDGIHAGDKRRAMTG